ncbi:MAG: Fe-S cluster assembly ATP-binding protein [Flavobacteriales bacterium]|jgi:Fe-S cluster assembly ATP-binding protein
MLIVNNLHVEIEGKKILNGINLQINAGEVHAIMGPNGSGKSTLAHVLAGREGYEITEGSITYMGKDLIELSVDERAKEGVFQAFQYPIEIPGVSTANFLKHTINAVRKHQEKTKLSAKEMLKYIKEKAKMVDMEGGFLSRSLNQGFSGGEKKRNEILQMAVLEPTLAVLDETDSGLDIDALKTVANGVNQLKTKDNAFVIITHYQRLLDYIIPDFVHVLYNGQIVKSGDKKLALQLEEKGYDWIKEEVATLTIS